MWIAGACWAVSAAFGGGGGACSPEWVGTFGGYPGASDYVRSFALHDDGGGAKVHVGFAGTLGAVTTSRVARWNGVEFEAVGALSVVPTALASYDHGSGARLYAGTYADPIGTSMVRVWDGQSWSPVPGGPVQFHQFVGGEVHAMVVHDDGGGAKLYVAGRLRMPTPQNETGVVAWNGSSWSTFGSFANEAFALHSTTIAGQHALFVGGHAMNPPGLGGPLSGVVRLANGAWSALPGAAGHAHAFTTFDFGSGRELVVGGGKDAIQLPQDFTAGVTSNNIARWDGVQWRAVGQGFVDAVVALAVFDTPGGARLVAGGTNVPARAYVLDGGAWAPIGAGFDQRVDALLPDPTSAPSKLWIGGEFEASGAIALGRIATWDGAAVRSLGEGLSGPVRASATWDDGNGLALYVGGDFMRGGEVTLSRIGRFDGHGWQALGPGLNGPVRALAVYDAGAGESLYAGGTFTQAPIPATPILARIARWDGNAWHPVGSGIGGPQASVEALAVFDAGQGAHLYVGGSFTSAGPLAAPGLARWNGSAWQSAASSVTGGTVRAMHVFDEGSGPRLFVGGSFTSIDNVVVNHVARFDGVSWSALASGIGVTPGSGVRALASFQSGAAAALYVGGDFLRASGVPSPGLARWNGAWSGVSGGVAGGGVRALAAGADGLGSALFVGGTFDHAGGVPASRVARFDGSTFAAMGEGQTDAVTTLTYVADGALAGVIAGGEFRVANSGGDVYLARWTCPPSAITAVPGCAGNPASLASSASAAPLGRVLPLSLVSNVAHNGAALLFAGPIGTGRDGCGFVLGGFGELLLALAPEPIHLVTAPLASAQADLSFQVPPLPGLAGITIGFQGVAFDALVPLEPSNALAVLLGP